jgi:hypothetical protein
MRSGRFMLKCLIVLFMLTQGVRDSITGQKPKLLIWCLSAPALTLFTVQSGRSSSAYHVSVAGTGVAVPSSLTRESNQSLCGGPDGRSSLRTTPGCNPILAFEPTLKPPASVTHVSNDLQDLLACESTRSLCGGPDGRSSLRTTPECTPILAFEPTLDPASDTQVSNDLQDPAASSHRTRQQSEDILRCRCSRSQRLIKATREGICRLNSRISRPCTAHNPLTSMSAKPARKGDAAHDPP